MIAVVGGAIRVSTPYLYVSLGETLTEKSGRVNLGLEGTLVMGAMSGYAIAYLTGSPWLGVLVAGAIGAGFGLLHAVVCSLPRVNDIAVGIALFLFGTGLAFFLGKPYIQPSAPRLPHLALGWWSSSPQIRVALEINALFVAGIVLALALRFILASTMPATNRDRKSTRLNSSHITISYAVFCLKKKKKKKKSEDSKNTILYNKQ